MNRTTTALSLFLTFGLFITGCDGTSTGPGVASNEAVQGPKQAPTAYSHGKTGKYVANGTYRAVKSTAAMNHGFRVGETVGEIWVTDDGSALTVKGTAEGLVNNDTRYVSLFYDKASPPQGPEACEPGVEEGHPLFLTLEQMEIGSGGTLDFWDVDSNGDATLGPTTTVAYVPAKMIGTVSIRDVTVNRGFGPEAVVACASVTHAPAGGPSSGS